MAEKDLRKLGKTELLELLVEQARENVELKARVAELEKQLADRRLLLEESGSVAEAALRLSGIFEAAQKAVDLYRENCERECAELIEKARRQAKQPDTPEGKEEPGR